MSVGTFFLHYTVSDSTEKFLKKSEVLIMGDPHKNRWGGKNNSWGNNRRKSNNKNQQRYEPTKLFNIIAGGIALWFCGAMGWSLITSTYSNIKDAKEKVEQVQEIANHVDSAIKSRSDNAGNENTADTSLEYNFDIIQEIDIDEEDIKDILDQLTEMGSSKEKVVIVAYSALDNKKSYEDDILSRLGDYDSTVAFVAFDDDTSYTKDEAKAENDRVADLINNNTDMLVDAGVTNYQARFLYHGSPKQDIAVYIIYMK